MYLEPEKNIRTLGGNKSLSLDLAEQLQGNMSFGRAVVISKQPKNLLASTSKQWAHLMRVAEREIARTLQQDIKALYTRVLADMRRLTFAADSTKSKARVIFTTAADFTAQPAECAALYFATPTEDSIITQFSKFVDPLGVVVVWRMAPDWLRWTTSNP